MGNSIGLAAYLALSARSVWLARLLQKRRLRLGKEDAARRDERFGRAGAARPPGPLAWFHSASIGEAVSILELVRRLGEQRPDLSFLMTTGTLSSAKVLKSRMPPRTIHQFAPYDVLPAVARFLDHWKPDAGIWTESEFWPALICETHRRRVPLLCINGRMSAGSFRRWRRVPSIAGCLLNRFEKALVQDARTADVFRQLGLAESRMEVVGSLKRGAADLPFDEAAREEFAEAIRGRPLWLAASTHEGEEDTAAAAHLELSGGQGDLLLVIVPRHPERGEEIAGKLRSRGIRVSLRSKSRMPGMADQVFIADTFGELGLWYRLAPVSFVGGSLAAAGGHNPFEPARLGSAVVHGPHVTNFPEEFKTMAQLGAAVLADGPERLAASIAYALEPENRKRLTAAAKAMTEGGDRVTDYVASVILRYLPPSAAL